MHHQQLNQQTFRRPASASASSQSTGGQYQRQPGRNGLLSVEEIEAKALVAAKAYAQWKLKKEKDDLKRMRCSREKVKAEREQMIFEMSSKIEESKEAVKLWEKEKRIAKRRNR